MSQYAYNYQSPTPPRVIKKHININKMVIEIPPGGEMNSDSLPDVSDHSTSPDQSSYLQSSAIQHNVIMGDRYMSESDTTGSGTACGGGASLTGSTSVDDDGEPIDGHNSEMDLPYPGFAALSMRYLRQDTIPRNWCLMLITNPYTWFERISMLVILLNCVTLGMYQPCVDHHCETNRCKILQMFDDIIFVFFTLEMMIKMVAMGISGKGAYLADSWNWLDFFIVQAGALEYCLHVDNMNLTAIRTIRVLRPLRAINRIPSMRILVMLLLDTLPMLGNVLLLCFFVFFIFGIVGVQLWEGILRQRCTIELSQSYPRPNLSLWYQVSKDQDYICSRPEDNGMHQCVNLPAYRMPDGKECNGTARKDSYNLPTNESCVNWNQYYTNCTNLGDNPFQGTISFDNIGLAWVAIFLVISLEGWTDIMYYVQDAHSFWDWIYFVLLIVIGSFFMINLCLVVIATQFSETKKREMERMRQERARFTSSSTLASSSNNSNGEGGHTCYAAIVRYAAHIWRRSKRRLMNKIQLYRTRRQQLKEQSLLGAKQSEHGRSHHPFCPRFGSAHLINQPRPPNGSRRLGSLNASSILNIDNMLGSRTQSPDEPQQESSKILTGPTLLRVPSISQVYNENSPDLLSPTSLMPPPRRRPSMVMFSDVVDHGVVGPNPNNQNLGLGTSNTSSSNLLAPASETNSGTNCGEKNSCQSEKMTQTGDGSIWQVILPQQSIQAHPSTITPIGLTNVMTSVPNVTSDNVECDRIPFNSDIALSCQQILALSGAISAALPTGPLPIESLYYSITKGISQQNEENLDVLPVEMEDFTCCYDLQTEGILEKETSQKRSKLYTGTFRVIKAVVTLVDLVQKHIKNLVEDKYFQQAILFAILINTLSMGIEYHDQPEGMTVFVELSNIAFSAIFAVEMLLKIMAEGPFKYISNGFNVFDGVIVVLSVVELCQTYLGDGHGSSGLSVLRTFRLLRILKLVRFMPNLRRQLFVMLRTMDNVAVFFSLLILFIFIFSILGMYLFGGKFCKFVDERGTELRECDCNEIVTKHPRCECDRKHFNNFLWATVTVFQILTQEDWNVVLFNGMDKTSHWAALYFVALMTFGNYVLFNLLVAILVEGFSSERNERREREQRELARSKLSGEYSDNDESVEESNSISESSDSFTPEMKNTWKSDTDIREKLKDSNGSHDRKSDKKADYEKYYELKRQLNKKPQCFVEFPDPKCNIEKQSKMLGGSGITSSDRELPIITQTPATPQDSPNTTLEPGMSFRTFPYTLSHSSLLDSLDSIDRTSCTSIPGLLKPPSNSKYGGVLAAVPSSNQRVLKTQQSLSNSSQIIINENPQKVLQNEAKNITKSNSNLAEKSTNSENGTSVVPGANGANGNGDKCKIQRNYSWKLPRASLRRKNSKKSRKGSSDSDTIMVLNNGRNHMQCNGNSQLQTRNNNQIIPTTNRIQNNTQGDAPNNKLIRGELVQGAVRAGQTISPQNSIKSQDNVPGHLYHPQPLPQNNPQPISQISFSKDDFNQVRLHKIHRCTIQPDFIYNPDNNNERINKQKNTACIIMSNIPEKDKSQSPPGQLPNLKNIEENSGSVGHSEDGCATSETRSTKSKFKKLFRFMESTGFLKGRDDYSLYLFPRHNRFRNLCQWLVNRKWFDNVVLLFIALNCITLAMERPNIPPDSMERKFLGTANYVFTAVFAAEMFVKVVSAGMLYGPDAYFTSGWNIMDGSLVIISIIDLLMSLVSESSPRIFIILRVFRLLRSLRPLRVINRAPGLKLVVQTLLSSLRPIGNIVLICCTFFIIFGILGVQLFKGAFYYCEGENIKHVKNRTDCESIPGNVWVNRKYNFDDLGQALMSLFVLSSRDGWVNIMYTGLDAVGVDQQPIVNHSEWRLLYFIAFILLVGFFVLNMFVGVVVENFHRCREEQEKEERVRRAAKRALQMEKKRRKMHEPPYYTDYSQARLFVHNIVTSKYFDLAIAAVIGLNVVTMALEYYKMPTVLEYTLKIFNYFFTAVFILEAIMKVIALGVKIYMKDKWNQLDVGIVILSVVGIVLEELETNIIPINPTIMRVMRVLRIARVLKLLKMAKGIRALLDTVMQALPQVGNLGLLFFLLFFIFAALGVELFGRLDCEDYPCQGLGEHAHFKNFGMAFLTLFRVATGDNWNGIMKDTLRDDCMEDADCVKNCCVNKIIAPIFFVIFVLMAQFVLVNVVVAVLMKHLEESHKQMEDEMDMDVQLQEELEREQEAEEDHALCLALQMECDSMGDQPPMRKPLAKVLSLPSNFTYSPPGPKQQPPQPHYQERRRLSVSPGRAQRRQSFQSHTGLPSRLLTLPAYNAIYETNLEQATKNDNSYYNKNNCNYENEKVFLSDNLMNKAVPEKAAPKKTDNERNELQIFTESENSSFLFVPKQQANKLYGSTKHLFKQQSFEEESCLLLPDSQKQENGRAKNDTQKDKQDNSGVKLEVNVPKLNMDDGRMEDIVVSKKQNGGRSKLDIRYTKESSKEDESSEEKCMLLPHRLSVDISTNETHKRDDDDMFDKQKCTLKRAKTNEETGLLISQEGNVRKSSKRIPLTRRDSTSSQKVDARRESCISQDGGPKVENKLIRRESLSSQKSIGKISEGHYYEKQLLLPQKLDVKQIVRQERLLLPQRQDSKRLKNEPSQRGKQEETLICSVLKERLLSPPKVDVPKFFPLKQELGEPKVATVYQETHFNQDSSPEEIERKAEASVKPISTYQETHFDVETSFLFPRTYERQDSDELKGSTSSISDNLSINTSQSAESLRRVIAERRGLNFEQEHLKLDLSKKTEIPGKEQLT